MNSTQHPWKSTGRTFVRPPEVRKSDRTSCTVCRHPYFAWNGERIDAFRLADSADSGDCLRCALIYRSMVQLDARLPPPDQTAFIRVNCRKHEPCLVEWQGTTRICAEIYDASPQSEQKKQIMSNTSTHPSLNRTSIWSSLANPNSKMGPCLAEFSYDTNWQVQFSA
jgi:hypothetical protein